MRYWAAGFLLTVLLFGGALLGAGKDTGTSRPVPDADPGQTGTVPGQSAADGAVLLRVWDGEQVVVRVQGEQQQWQIASWALAHAKTHDVVAVQTPDRVWERADGAGAVLPSFCDQLCPHANKNGMALCTTPFFAHTPPGTAP